MPPQTKGTLECVPAETHLHRPIIVLGMHRSGTSLVAELIDKCGAFGNDEFLPADYRNPQGYWEYAPLVHFNRRLLASVRSQSFVPPSDQDERTLRERASLSPWKSEATQLISAMEVGERGWYWKDPRLAVMLPFWQQFWGEAVFVIAVREPSDTALSLEKRDKLPLTAGYLLWQRYMTAALKHTEREPRRIFVQYERLLAEPVRECRRLCGFLEAHCRLTETKTLGQRVDSMIAAVNPKLRSNSSPTSFFATPNVIEGQKSLYRYLQSKANDQDEVIGSGAFDIYPGWRDYLQALAALDELRDTLKENQLGLFAKLEHKLSRKVPTKQPPW